MKNQEMNKPAGLGGQMLASRQKYWKELNASEKVERMREVIHRLQESVENLRRTNELLTRHSHDKDGNTVVVNRLGNSYGEQTTVGCLNRPGMNPDEVYF